MKKLGSTDIGLIIERIRAFGDHLEIQQQANIDSMMPPWVRGTDWVSDTYTMDKQQRRIKI